MGECHTFVDFDTSDYTHALVRPDDFVEKEQPPTEEMRRKGAESIAAADKSWGSRTRFSLDSGRVESILC